MLTNQPIGPGNEKNNDKQGKAGTAHARIPAEAVKPDKAWRWQGPRRA